MSAKKKTKMGRPHLPKGSVKDVKIIIRVTEKVNKAILAGAKKSGQCLTHFVRDAITEKLNRER